METYFQYDMLADELNDLLNDTSSDWYCAVSCFINDEFMSGTEKLKAITHLRGYAPYGTKWHLNFKHKYTSPVVKCLLKHYTFENGHVIRIEAKLEVFHDGYYSKEHRHDQGLYLIGSTNFNPYDENEKLYLIKVGYTTDIQRRMKEYDTTNPMYFKADIKVLNNDTIEDLRDKEKHCHKILRSKALSKCERNDEWFLMSEEMYKKICKDKFDFFFDD